MNDGTGPWGSWVHHPDTGHLTTDAGGYEYDIPTEGLDVQAVYEDWYHQLSEKTWVIQDRSVLADFERAVKDLIAGGLL